MIRIRPPRFKGSRERSGSFCRRFGLSAARFAGPRTRNDRSGVSGVYPDLSPSSPLKYNLRNFLRRLALPRPVKHWSLTTLRDKLIKIAAKVVRHAKHVTFQLAEVAVPRELFAAILDGIQRFGVPLPLVQRGWRGDQTKPGDLWGQRLMLRAVRRAYPCQPLRRDPHPPPTCHPTPLAADLSQLRAEQD